MKEIKEKETILLSFAGGHIGQVLAKNDVTHRLGSQNDPQGTQGQHLLARNLV